MKISLKGSTNNIKTKEEALQFGAAAARVCYSEEDFDALVEEDKEKLIKRTLSLGHHSVYDHIKFNFYFEEFPKIGAMIFNNEKAYDTSEKSARYTEMDPCPHQKELYDKWKPIFKERIEKKYPQLSETKTGKLAKENARYVTSVFTPTKMLHTFSFRQLNYIMHYFDEHIKEHKTQSKFDGRVYQFMHKFNTIIKDDFDMFVKELQSMNKRRLSLFAKRESFEEEFGESYSANYNVSFACLAQLHRHRTLNYEMQPINDNDEPEFFIPPILDTKTLQKQWQKDLESVAEYDYPQGMLIDIHEIGTYNDFISKMCERLCGHAQWEIMNQTKKTLEKYINETENKNPEIHDILVENSNGPRCTFPEISCRSPCEFGEELGIERLI